MEGNLVDKLAGRNGFLSKDICILCGVGFYGLPGFCPDCYAELTLITTACPRCSRELPVPGTCADCLINKQNFVFSDCVAAFSYNYPLDKIIQQFKFNGRITHAGPLGYLLANKIRLSNICLPECLIPVPLHITRQLYRGYNQSAEIARVLSRRLQLPLEQNICKRIRATRAQSFLKAKQRKQNIQGSFMVGGKNDYQHIAIVDDVMTTGTTANELAKTLIKSGVKRISVWVCARSQA